MAGFQRSRADENQAKIVEFLNRVGASVHITSQVGEGFPDLIVGFRSKNYLIEIKNPETGKIKLSKKQKIWHRRWKGLSHIAVSESEVAQIIGAIDDPEIAATIAARYILEVLSGKAKNET